MRTHWEYRHLAIKSIAADARLALTETRACDTRPTASARRGSSQNRATLRNHHGVWSGVSRLMGDALYRQILDRMIDSHDYRRISQRYVGAISQGALPYLCCTVALKWFAIMPAYAVSANTNRRALSKSRRRAKISIMATGFASINMLTAERRGHFDTEHALILVFAGVMQRGHAFFAR